MKKLYRHIETGFEKLTGIILNVLNNSITFIVAVGMVLLWLSGKDFSMQTLHQKLENIIVAVSFITLFAIQKEFKRFAASLHIKLNELISSNKEANNKIMIVEEKTESELQELTKIYADSATAEMGKEVI